MKTGFNSKWTPLYPKHHSYLYSVYFHAIFALLNIYGIQHETQSTAEAKYGHLILMHPDLKEINYGGEKLNESQGIIKVIRIRPQGSMNGCTTFHGIPVNC